MKGCKAGTAWVHLATKPALPQREARIALRVQRSSSASEAAGRRKQASKARQQACCNISLSRSKSSSDINGEATAA